MDKLVNECNCLLQIFNVLKELIGLRDRCDAFGPTLTWSPRLLCIPVPLFVRYPFIYFSAKTFLVDGAIITAHIQNVIAFYLFWLVQFYVKYSSLSVLVHPVLTLINSKCILL